MKRIKISNGFTLVELLLAVFILSVGIGAILLLFSHSLNMSEIAWDRTQATTHSEYLLEEMQSRGSLQDITATDWQKWAQEENILTLPNDTIAVEFTDSKADPLDVQVKINWERNNRSNSLSLATKLTK